MDTLNLPSATTTPRVALLAHDTCKDELIAWATENLAILARCELHATGKTGKLLLEATGLPIELLLSCVDGGDAQLSKMVSAKEVDYVIFFADPLTAQHHERRSALASTYYDVPTVGNRAAANFLVSSPLLFDAEALRRQRRSRKKAWAS